MYDFFTHSAILLWSIIATILGAVGLVLLVGLIIYEIVAFFSRFVPTNTENEE